MHFLRWKNIINLCYCLLNLLIYVCKYRHCLRLAFLFISFLALGWMQHSPTQAPHLTPCSIPTYLARWWPRTSRRSTSLAPATRGIRQTRLTEPLCSLRPRENQPIQVGDNLFWVKRLDDQWLIQDLTGAIPHLPLQSSAKEENSWWITSITKSVTRKVWQKVQDLRWAKINFWWLHKQFARLRILIDRLFFPKLNKYLHKSYNSKAFEPIFKQTKRTRFNQMLVQETKKSQSNSNF